MAIPVLFLPPYNSPMQEPHFLKLDLNHQWQRAESLRARRILAISLFLFAIVLGVAWALGRVQPYHA